MKSIHIFGIVRLGFRSGKYLGLGDELVYGYATARVRV